MTAQLSVTVNRQVFGRMDREVTARTRALAQRIFEGVVQRSPVRTGSFRASWRIARNAPDLTIVNGGSPTSPLPPPVFPAIELKIGDEVWISNNQPYAARLEYGWSDQAPLGVLRITLASVGIATV